MGKKTLLLYKIRTDSQTSFCICMNVSFITISPDRQKKPSILNMQKTENQQQINCVILQAIIEFFMQVYLILKGRDAYAIDISQIISNLPQIISSPPQIISSPPHLISNLFTFNL